MKAQTDNLDLRTARLAGRVQAPKNAPVTIPALLVIGAWGLLVVIDSIWGKYVPASSFMRLGIPAILSIVAITNLRARNAKRANLLLIWMILFILGAVVSSLACAAPKLAFLKLALYLLMFVPLIRSAGLLDNFLPRNEGFWYFTLAALAILGLSILTIPRGHNGMFLRNANALGAFTLVVFPLALFYAHHPNSLRRTIGRISLFAVYAACLMSMSRGACLGLFCGTVTFFGLRYSPYIRSVITVGCVALLGAIGMFIFSDSATAYAYKGGSSIIDGQRQNMISESSEAFSQRPVLGYGFGLSWLVTPENGEEALRTGKLSRVVGEFGNSTLAVLCGGGLIVAVPLFFLICTPLYTGVISLRSNCSRWPYRYYQLALLAGIVAMCVESQAEGWILAPMNWVSITFWFYVGLLYRTATAVRTSQATNGSTDQQQSSAGHSQTGHKKTYPNRPKLPLRAATP